MSIDKKAVSSTLIVFFGIFLFNSLCWAKTIPLSSREGAELFEAAEFKKDFFSIIDHYETQKTPTYCAIASSVIVLNILVKDKPQAFEYDNLAYFTQDNFFNPQIEKIINKNHVAQYGVTLDQTADLLTTFGLKVKKLHANELNTITMKEIIIKQLNDKNNYILVNFSRPLLDQKGLGHFSPVAAYNSKSDSFLIADVARFRYGPFWVKSDDLFKSIDTEDSDSKEKRGIIIVSR